MIEDEDSVYACCSFGIGRWCWVVWASDSDARAGAKPLAEGYEKTAEAAEKKAVATAGPQSKRLPGKWASGYKRGGASRNDGAGQPDKPKSRLSRRAVAPPGRNDPRPLTFLYAASESDQAGARGEVVVKHRIVRQTAGKIYVEREPFQEEEWQSREAGTPGAAQTRLLAVDRATLRREGRFPHRGTYFYASEQKAIEGVHADLTARHDWCAALGVSFPCTTESIKAAYRQLAREKHPDAGGDQAEFRALERAYREALAYVSSREDAAERL